MKAVVSQICEHLEIVSRITLFGQDLILFITFIYLILTYYNTQNPVSD